MVDRFEAKLQPHLVKSMEQVRECAESIGSDLFPDWFMQPVQVNQLHLPSQGHQSNSETGFVH